MVVGCRIHIDIPWPVHPLFDRAPLFRRDGESMKSKLNMSWMPMAWPETHRNPISWADLTHSCHSCLWLIAFSNKTVLDRLVLWISGTALASMTSPEKCQLLCVAKAVSGISLPWTTSRCGTPTRCRGLVGENCLRAVKLFARPSTTVTTMFHTAQLGTVNYPIQSHSNMTQP